MHMFFLGELRLATINIFFSTTYLLVSCLTITSRARSLADDSLCTSVNEWGYLVSIMAGGQEGYFFHCLNDEAAKATWRLYLDKQSDRTGLAEMKRYLTGFNMQNLLPPRAHLAVMRVPGLDLRHCKFELDHYN